MYDLKVKTFLVCGMTGVGKSTFINAATGGELSVSDDIESDTVDVIEEGIPFIRIGDECVQLVDTPGFGDSREESETVILRRITTWLVARHISNVPVTGVIFLRPLDRVRVDRLEKSLMIMFKDMVGDNHLDHIFLLTTRWPSTPNEQYEKRENDIATRNDILGLNGQKVVQTLRLQEGYSFEDARRAVEICAGLSPMVFKIQREVADEDKTLGQTQAGMRIGAGFEEKISGVEEKAKRAREYAAKGKKKLEEAEEAKRELERQVAQTTEEAKRAEENAKNAEKEAEAAKEKSEKMCIEAEEKAKRAEEDRKAAQKAAKEARQLSERMCAEAESKAKQAEEDKKAAQEAVEEARRQSERMRAGAESRAKQAEEDRRAAHRAAEEARERFERERKAKEEKLARLEATARQAAEREEQDRRNIQELQERIEALSRPVERGFWDHIGNAPLRGVTFGQVGFW